jgi:serine/threonine protein kinase
LQLTAHARGTPLYSAPEMLINPYSETNLGEVAKPSRKTDIYAFAVLAWEVMTQKQPFEGVQSQTMLCAKVHQVKF